MIANYFVYYGGVRAMYTNGVVVGTDTTVPSPTWSSAPTYHFLLRGRLHVRSGGAFLDGSVLASLIAAQFDASPVAISWRERRCAMG